MFWLKKDQHNTSTKNNYKLVNIFLVTLADSSGSCLSLQVSALPQESRTLKSTVPEGAELQAECLLVREVSVCLCVGVCGSVGVGEREKERGREL